jgi:hypothetical protein
MPVVVKAELTCALLGLPMWFGDRLKLIKKLQYVAMLTNHDFLDAVNH